MLEQFPSESLPWRRSAAQRDASLRAIRADYQQFPNARHLQPPVHVDGEVQAGLAFMEKFLSGEAEADKGAFFRELLQTARQDRERMLQSIVQLVGSSHRNADVCDFALTSLNRLTRDGLYVEWRQPLRSALGGSPQGQAYAWTLNR